MTEKWNPQKVRSAGKPDGSKFFPGRGPCPGMVLVGTLQNRSYQSVKAVSTVDFSLNQMERILSVGTTMIMIAASRWMNELSHLAIQFSFPGFF